MTPDLGVPISVFDTLRRRVAEVFDGPAAPGSHRIVFDVGSHSSSACFHVLAAGSHRIVRAMQLVK